MPRQKYSTRSSSACRRKLSRSSSSQLANISICQARHHINEPPRFLRIPVIFRLFNKKLHNATAKMFKTLVKHIAMFFFTNTEMCSKPPHSCQTEYGFAMALLLWNQAPDGPPKTLTRLKFHGGSIGDNALCLKALYPTRSAIQLVRADSSWSELVRAGSSWFEP